MSEYQIRSVHDVVLDQATLSTDNRAMAWAVHVATEKRRVLHGEPWVGYRRVGDEWRPLFRSGYPRTR